MFAVPRLVATCEVKPDRAVNPPHAGGMTMNACSFPEKLGKNQALFQKEFMNSEPNLPWFFCLKAPQPFSFSRVFIETKKVEISWPPYEKLHLTLLSQKICQICRAPKSSQFSHIRLTGGSPESSAMFTSDKGLDFRKDSRT